MTQLSIMFEDGFTREASCDAWRLDPCGLLELFDTRGHTISAFRMVKCVSEMQSPKELTLEETKEFIKKL